MQDLVESLTMAESLADQLSLAGQLSLMVLPGSRMCTCFTCYTCMVVAGPNCARLVAFYSSPPDDFAAKLTDTAARLARGFQALHAAVPPPEAPLLNDCLRDLQRDLQSVSLPTLRSYQQQAADLRHEVERLCAQRRLPLRAAPTALATEEGFRAAIRDCLKEVGLTAASGAGEGSFGEQVPARRARGGRSALLV